MIRLEPVALVHVPVLAALHGICFAEPWNEESMAGVLGMPGASGLLAVDAGGDPHGLVLWRVAADEAEILTLCVLPPYRRGGLGDRLLTAAMNAARAQGATRQFLEVADGNSPALALYHAQGFEEIGRRKGYYRGVDALVMGRALTQVD